MSIERVAVVQDCPVVFDAPATIRKVGDLTEAATKQGAKLVLFPEAFIAAYPKGLDFGARIGGRTHEGREDFRRYFESAIDVPGPDTDALGAIACENKVFLVIGVIVAIVQLFTGEKKRRLESTLDSD